MGIPRQVTVHEAPVEAVSLSHQAQTIGQSGNLPSSDDDDNPIIIRAFDPSFSSQKCKYSVVKSTKFKEGGDVVFYKGPAYIEKADRLYVNSGLLYSSSYRLPLTITSKLSFERASSPDLTVPPESLTTVRWDRCLPNADIRVPSGAIPYEEGVLHCSQGTKKPDSGGLFYQPLDGNPIPLVTNYFGKPFNSIQDVAMDVYRTIWFTDSCAGYEAGIRPKPQLLNKVYWFHPRTGELRVVADDLKSPTGINVSPKGDTIYIIDTDASWRDNATESRSSATIYAYDVFRRRTHPPLLANKRVFTFAICGVPTDIKCDAYGNVFAAFADGIKMWNSGGTPLGVIQIQGGCCSFCFGRDQELFICNGHTVWWVKFERNESRESNGSWSR
ncbi:hypothetical protein GGS21DRAFT_489788 [Xylaria nigripes]|nr:hypothetical protein GGS21DRAFT_489788 [Xylaria nigripes]